MGKKASLNFDLDYDLDHWDDDQTDEEIRFQPKSIKSVPKRAVEPQFKRSSSTIHGCSNSQIAVKLYQKRPLGMVSPFWTLLLNGHDSMVLHIAAFLGIRSISALSCANKTLDKALAQEFLYCRPKDARKGDVCSSLLPCMHGLSLPTLQNPHLARCLALESTLFWKRSGPRDRTLKNLQTIRCESDRAILASMLSRSGESVSYISDLGEFISNKLSLSPATSNDEKASKPIIRKTSSCLRVLSYAMAQANCIILSMPSTGLRRYVLSLIPTSSDGRRNAWQQEIFLSSRPGSSLISTAPSIKMDVNERYVVVVLSGQISIFSVEEGTLLCELSLDKHHQTWHSWIVHDHFIVALAKKTLLIFDIHRQSLVASGRLPSKTFAMKDLVQWAPQIEVLQDRVWIACFPVLLCSGCIFRRLECQREKLTEDITPVARPLLIKKFHPVTNVATKRPILRKHGNCLFLADGNVIKVYDQSAMDGKCQEPSQILCTEAPIEFLQADSTKIVCGIRDGKKRRIEILRLDTTAQSHKALYESIFIKNAAIFCDRHDIDHLEIQGGRLLVSYASCRDGVGRGEIRIFNLIDSDE